MVAMIGTDFSLKGAGAVRASCVKKEEKTINLCIKKKTINLPEKTINLPEKTINLWRKRKTMISHWSGWLEEKKNKNNDD